MHVFGITGGIACGKTAVAALMARRGLDVVDADQIARDVVAPGSEGLRAIVDAFGDGVLDARGALDRQALADIVFADHEKKLALEAITHPLIGKASREAFAALGARGAPLVGYDASLLVERGLADAFRPLVVVTAPEDVRIERAMARDNASRDAVVARIRAQLPMEEKIRVADIVVHNDADLGVLESRADDALRQICARAHVDPARYGL